MNRLSLTLLSLALASCSGVGEPSQTPAPTAAPTQSAAPTPTGGMTPTTASTPTAAATPTAGSTPSQTSPPSPTPTAGPAPFDWCPTAADYVGDDSWPLNLDVAPNTLLCALFQEQVTLQEALAHKAQLWIPPGRYALPDEGTHALKMPACVTFDQEGTHPTLDAVGSVTANVNTFGDAKSWYLNATQEATGPGETTREFQMTLNWYSPDGSDPGPLTLGPWPQDPFGENSASARLCDPGETCYGAELRLFDSCTYETYPAQRHHVTFAGGEITLELHIGESAASTEPGAFTRAWGSLGETAFDQRDYWRLVYSPDHHHFNRHFAVLFETPIGGACGLKITNASPWPEHDGWPEVATVGCALEEIAALKVEAYTFEREE